MEGQRGPVRLSAEERKNTKVALAINNEEYLRAHPELRTLLHGFVSALVETKPDDAVAFASAWFCKHGLASTLGLSGYDEGGIGLVAEAEDEADPELDVPDAAEPEAPAAVDADGTTGSHTDRDLEVQLVSMFRQADLDGSGSLDRDEFLAVMRTASLGLTAAELRRLLSEADENADGEVDYKEFSRVAIDVLQAMRAREVVQAEVSELDAEAQTLANTIVNGLPREEMASSLRAAFDAYDLDGSGKLSRAELRHVLADARASLAPRMARLIMALLDAPPDEQVSFDDFCAASLRVLSEQYQLELRAASGDALEARLIELAGAADTGEAGVLSRAAAIDLLLAQDVLTISRVQATAVVGQLNAGGGPLQLVRFIPMAAAMLRALAKPAAAAERARMLARADFAPLELMGGREREALSEAFAAAFARHDLDSSQTLDEAEFELCLSSAELSLERHEIVALIGMADVNGDGVIDAREFLDFSYDFLLQVRREQKIQEVLAKGA